MEEIFVFKGIAMILNDQININIMIIKANQVMKMCKYWNSELYVCIFICYFHRNDIDIPDEDNEEEIIRRQRLRREQLKKVRN